MMVHLLRKIREDNKKTQGEFSKELGISQSALSQMEITDRVPSMKIFLALVSLSYVNETNIFGIIKDLLKITKKKK